MAMGEFLSYNNLLVDSKGQVCSLALRLSWRLSEHSQWSCNRWHHDKHHPNIFICYTFSRAATALFSQSSAIRKQIFM